MSIHERLKAAGISPRAPQTPAGAFVHSVRSGNLLFLSGHIARRDGKPWRGRLGEDMTTAQGKEAARAVAIDLIGTLGAATESLESVRRIVKLLVLVNSAPDYGEQHLVANGASELLREIFGDAGAHARSATSRSFPSGAVWRSSSSRSSIPPDGVDGRIHRRTSVAPLRSPHAGAARLAEPRRRSAHPITNARANRASHGMDVAKPL